MNFAFAVGYKKKSISERLTGPILRENFAVSSNGKYPAKIPDPRVYFA